MLGESLILLSLRLNDSPECLMPRTHLRREHQVSESGLLLQADSEPEEQPFGCDKTSQVNDDINYVFKHSSAIGQVKAYFGSRKVSR